VVAEREHNKHVIIVYMPKSVNSTQKSAKSVKSVKSVTRISRRSNINKADSYNIARDKMIKIIRFFIVNEKPIINHSGPSISGFCQLSGSNELLQSTSKEDAISKTIQKSPHGISCDGICGFWNQSIKDDPEAQEKLWEAIQILQKHRNKLLTEKIIITSKGIFDINTGVETIDPHLNGGNTKTKIRIYIRTRKNKHYKVRRT
jgi:hypothetical protein